MRSSRRRSLPKWMSRYALLKQSCTLGGRIRGSLSSGMDPSQGHTRGSRHTGDHIRYPEGTSRLALRCQHHMDSQQKTNLPKALKAAAVKCNNDEVAQEVTTHSHESLRSVLRTHGGIQAKKLVRKWRKKFFPTAPQVGDDCSMLPPRPYDAFVWSHSAGNSRPVQVSFTVLPHQSFAFGRLFHRVRPLVPG